MLVQVHAPTPPDPHDGSGVPNTGRSAFGWSYYGKFRKCPRAFAFAYRSPLAEQDRRGARSRGTVVHALVANWYESRMGKMTRPAIEVMEAECERLSVVGDDKRRAWGAFRALHTFLVGDTLRPIAVEQEYATTFGPSEGGGVCRDGQTLGDVPYTARLDHTVIDLYGRIWIVDIKTATNPSWFTLHNYGRHGQIHGQQVLGERHFGTQFGGVMILLVGTVPPFSIIRAQPRIKWPSVGIFPRTIRNIAADIADSDRLYGTNPWAWEPLSHEDGCVGRYGVCDFDIPCTEGKYA